MPKPRKPRKPRRPRKLRRYIAVELLRLARFTPPLYLRACRFCIQTFESHLPDAEFCSPNCFSDWNAEQNLDTQY